MIRVIAPWCANCLIVCPPFAEHNGGQEKPAHQTLVMEYEDPKTN
jgi:hypothetical protein